MKNTTRIILFLLFCLVTHTAVYAQFHMDTPEGPLVTVQLIAEQDAIVPNTPFTVALKQEITAGWHTYWVNPGDTGLETKVTWQLPEGFTADPMQFPTPHRQPIGDLVNYGYENSAMFLTTITPPSNLQIGQEVTLQGKASWLVCKESCIPEQASFILTLPVQAASNPSPWSSAFIAARTLLPQTHNAVQIATHDAENLTLILDPLPLALDQLPEEAYFFPHDGLLINHNADQKMVLDGRKLTLKIPKNTTRSVTIDKVSGDIWLRTMTGAQSFRFDAPVTKDVVTAAVPLPVIPTIPDQTAEVIKAPSVPVQTLAPPLASPLASLPKVESMSLFVALLSAFFGGILLNLMPCVFPVLSLKALSLVKKAHHEDRRHVIYGGLSYTFGVLTSFALLAGALVVLKETGHHIGWGVQLQSTYFVASMALLLFAIGYFLIGSVTIGSGLMGIGSNLANRNGLVGSFFTGALAVIVATPCTAPFMGGAIFYGLTQSPIITLSVLLALGLGLAIPYLLLTLFPSALKILPKPGIWMEHFKQFLAFPMMAAAIWMVWVLSQQAGSSGVLLVLLSMLSFSFALWLYGTTQNRSASLWQIFKKLLALIAFGLAIYCIVMQPTGQSQNQNTDQAYYQTWSPEKLARLRAEGKPVFINMTAAWCISCLANEKAALSTDQVKQFFKDNNVIYLKGDWTNYDNDITEYLKEFGRSGVPLYVFYPADQTKPPVVLQQVLTPSVIINTITPNLGE
jgi:thiol:disulfide interchange protein DsbD